MNTESLERIGVKRVRELFNYNKDTGVFTNKFARAKSKKGQIVGITKRSSGGLKISFDSKMFATHSVAYFYVTGEVSKIRHKDKNKANNSFSNLISYKNIGVIKMEQQFLSEVFEYKEDTGKLHYKFNTISSLKGDIACDYGELHGRYYVILNRSAELSHRIIYAMKIGKLINGMDIDHIDGNKTNNLVNNLRQVTRSENCRNINNDVIPQSSTGVRGVRYRKDRDVYIASIEIDKEKICLGSFSDLDDAIKSRKEAEDKYGFYI